MDGSVSPVSKFIAVVFNVPYISAAVLLALTEAQDSRRAGGSSCRGRVDCRGVRSIETGRHAAHIAMHVDQN